MKTAEEILRGKLSCTCYEAYKIRKMADPDCALCENTSEIIEAMEEYASSVITKTIGELKEGEHPDEIKPRGATWLQERENWKSEVERLRKHIEEINFPTDEDVEKAFPSKGQRAGFHPNQNAIAVANWVRDFVLAVTPKRKN